MENNIELEEKLISFETAKLAKKKGFNVHCRWRFDDENGDLYENEDFPYNSWNGSLFAPTQSLLQKWLREKHNTHITIEDHTFVDIVNEGSGWKFYVEVYGCTEIGRGKLYNSYEDALEFGLLEALKLIK